MSLEEDYLFILMAFSEAECKCEHACNRFTSFCNAKISGNLRFPIKTKLTGSAGTVSPKKEN